MVKLTDHVLDASGQKCATCGCDMWDFLIPCIVDDTPPPVHTPTTEQPGYFRGARIRKPQTGKGNSK